MTEFTRIKTRTSGFSSPATDYAKSRLKIEGIVLEDPYFTFFFRVGEGIKNSIIKTGDILIVNRKKDPVDGDICLGVNSEDFVVYRYGKVTPEDHWGVVVLIIPESHG